jgi:hypothetical protein
MTILTQMSFSCTQQRNTTTSIDDNTATMRWPLLRTTAAQVARNDLTTRCIQNLWRGNFSKVITFFNVKILSVLAQQGDLGVTCLCSCLLTSFTARSRLYTLLQESNFQFWVLSRCLRLERDIKHFNFYIHVFKPRIKTETIWSRFMWEFEDTFFCYFFLPPDLTTF